MKKRIAAGAIALTVVFASLFSLSACKLFDGLLASFGGESELLERDFTNRLQEIEKEIEQEREAQQNVEEQPKTNSKWIWGK